MVNEHAEHPTLATPERVSFLAVLALICGILCFPPGTGLLAIVFGIAAMVLIAKSHGRLAGRGMAVIGMVLGVTFTVMWGAIAIGSATVLQQLRDTRLVPTAETMRAIQDRDYQKATQYFDPSVRDRLSPEVFDTFRSAYTQQVGDFRQMPTGLWDIFETFMEERDRLRGQQVDLRFENVLPVPAQFDQGLAVIVIPIPTDRDPLVSEDPDALNLGIVTPDGTQIWILDAQRSGTVVSPPGG
jgi:hypothetical protein